MRVSSEEQGRSGFGLRSQEAEIKAFAQVNRYKIIQWNSDVASAIGGASVPDRPGLRTTMEKAKKLHVPVLISRLDRLSRDTSELEDLSRQHGVEFISVREGPASDPLVLKVQGARIERESQMLSESTKAGLQRAKKEGRVLGNTKNLPDAQKKGAATNSRKAEHRRLELTPIISEVQAAGMKTATAIADALNKRSVPTPSGKPWTGPNVRTILKDIERAEKLKTNLAIEDHYKDDPIWGTWG
jgi:DNA invertase Pin-like site-specific DNA recombinase